MTFQDMAVMTF